MTRRLGPALLGGAVAAAAALALPNAPLAAQQAAATTPAPAVAGAPRAPLGVTVGSSGSNRDTLGLLVVAVTAQSPADRAGVVEGSRLASVNGVRLRLTPAEVGESGTADALVRRFDDVLQNLRPGEPVVLEVVGGGRRQTLAIPLGGESATVLAASSVDPSAATTPGVPPAAPTPVAAVLVPAAPAAAAVLAAVPAAAATSPVAGAPAPVAIAPAPVDTARGASLPALIDQMGALQQQLHRLARAQSSLATADTLADAEDDLAAVRQRLRTMAARQARADSANSAGEAAPGLRLAPVNADLASYFGEGSERGLLVVQADAAWDPVRTGDVILRVDGAPVDVAHLRAAFDPHRRGTIELLRRRRRLTVTLH